jgi:hypothetical protein
MNTKPLTRDDSYEINSSYTKGFTDCLDGILDRMTKSYVDKQDIKIWDITDLISNTATDINNKIQLEIIEMKKRNDRRSF